MDLFRTAEGPRVRGWVEKVRESVKTSLDEYDVDSITMAVTYQIMKAVGRFFLSESSQKSPGDTEAATESDVLLPFDNDWCIFEILCFVLAKLGMWVRERFDSEFLSEHFQGVVVSNCLKVFSRIFPGDSVDATYLSRLRFYTKASRSAMSGEEEIRSVVRFVHRANVNEKPVPFEEGENLVAFLGMSIDSVMIAARLGSMMQVTFRAFMMSITWLADRVKAAGGSAS